MENPEFLFSEDGLCSTKVSRVRGLSVIPSESFRTNNPKEQICLDRTAQFEHAQRVLKPNGRKLVINPNNEHGVQKYVCTTVRSSKLVFEELHPIEKCAEFVANYIEYEPLHHPTKCPDVIPSPSQVLEWQIGDCFDLSMVLCSFLVGIGYDAYVVQGTANREVCLRDLSASPCSVPLLEEDLEFENDSVEPQKEECKSIESVKENPYYVPAQMAVASSYRAEVKEEENKVVIDPLDATIQQRLEIREAMKLKEEQDDPLVGQRVHCWVLVRAGSQGVEKHVYVEPSTGQVYSISDSPFEHIDALWNSTMYYVHHNSKALSKDVLFDFNDDSVWTNATAEIEGEIQPIPVPASWVPKLRVPRGYKQNMFGSSGQKMTRFHKTLLEQYRPAAHPQGLVRRISVFEDLDMCLPSRVQEVFANRRDRLCRRDRYPLESTTVEHFLPGGPSALKKLKIIAGAQREMDFYPTSRLDGLCKRVEKVEETLQDYFSGSVSTLAYRGAKFVKKDGIPSLVKMTEKFNINPKLGDLSIAVRKFVMDESTIRVIYHCQGDRITASSRFYSKNEGAIPEVVNVDSFKPEPTAVELRADLADHIVAEKQCLNAVRAAQKETADILKTRRLEEEFVRVEHTIQELALQRRHQEQLASEAQAADNGGEQSVDYLTPFLQFVINPNNISKSEAQKARDDCLRALKERLLERANIIQRRLDEENSQLAKKQAAFQRSRDHVDGADEEFEQFCSEAMFRIQILESRLQRHEETALHKYAQLDQKLHTDPRLRVLYQ
eukprot:TRINITY_DN2734_c0_g2_i1.p1 TRINITY_DN2734_c0_g2~~TRINITY_DN2734_c0_g2_i1.p1  ORF type:complete len:779 (-),score=234.22 TRINITY_DN2734_c0_g2_i1:166-2502(-)